MQLVAYPRGIRTTDKSIATEDAVDTVVGLVLCVPIVLFWMAFQYLRYRIAYGGQWEVEVRDPKSSRSIVSRIVPDRAAAICLVQQTADRLATVDCAEDAFVPGSGPGLRSATVRVARKRRQ